MNKISNNSKLQNFYVRTASTIIILPPVIYAIYCGGFFYFMTLFVLALLAGYEWCNICGKWSFGIDGMTFITVIVLAITSTLMEYYKITICVIAVGSYITYFVSNIRVKSENSVLIPAYISRTKWMTIGLIYLAFCISSMAYLGSKSPGLVMWAFLGTVFNDVFAYIFGSLIGGKKIAPKVSPGKSWSGFIAASFFTMLLGYFIALAVDSHSEIYFMIIGLFMSFFAHLGDMLESAFKRYIDIKDTSNLIPGHGGILDRIDALLLVSLYLAVITLIMGNPLNM